MLIRVIYSLEMLNSNLELNYRSFLGYSVQVATIPEAVLEYEDFGLRFPAPLRTRLCCEGAHANCTGSHFYIYDF